MLLLMFYPKRIEYILEWNLLEKSAKRTFYCFHTAAVLHIFLLYNLLGPGTSFYRKSKINIKRKPNYEIGFFKKSQLKWIVIHTLSIYCTAYNLWTFTWFVHFELPFRLKGTDKIHTEGLSKFHSHIYSILFGCTRSLRTNLLNKLVLCKLHNSCVACLLCYL